MIADIYEIMRDCDEESEKKIKELEAENERLNRELKQMDVQDQVVFDGLRKENERLKAEVRKWQRDSAITSAMFRLVVQGKECTSTKVLEEAERVENLEKENAKLKCLAIHGMSDFLWLKNRWIRYFVDSATGRHILSEDERKSRLNKARRIERHAWFYLEAYHNAKKALREGK